MLTRMAGLGAALAARGAACRARWGARRVGRGWFGRVAGMLLELGFQVSNAGLELGDLLLKELILRHKREQGQQGNADRGRCYSPIGGRDSQWRWFVHGPIVAWRASGGPERLPTCNLIEALFDS